MTLSTPELDECRGLEDGESFLQALDLCFALGLLLFVCHHLHLALWLELLNVRHHCIELFGDHLEILTSILDGNLEALHLRLGSSDFCCLRCLCDLGIIQ